MGFHHPPDTMWVPSDQAQQQVPSPTEPSTNPSLVGDNLPLLYPHDALSVTLGVKEGRHRV